MIKKVMLITLAIVVVSLLDSTQASAHFIIKDPETGVKAVFHITPDHDPIAGEESVISYDFSKTGLIVEDYSYKLTVKSTKSEVVSTSFETSGNVVLASYTFASQGFYDIKLTVTSKETGRVSQLQYGQRVSRGVVVKEDKTVSPVEIGLTIFVIIIAASALIFSIVSERTSRKGKRNEKGSRR